MAGDDYEARRRGGSPQKLPERARLNPADWLPPFRQVLDYVKTFASVFEGRSVARQRLALTKLMVSAVPVKYGQNRYGIDPVLTELGHRLLQVAPLVGGDTETQEAYKSSCLRTVN